LGLVEGDGIGAMVLSSIFSSSYERNGSGFLCRAISHNCNYLKWLRQFPDLGDGVIIFLYIVLDSFHI